MAQAIWNDTIIAESDDIVMVEGNHYFPAESIKQEYFTNNDRTTVCPWKGVAGYYDLVVNGEINKGAAWYYPSPKGAAKMITGRVAFWRGVRIVT